MINLEPFYEASTKSGFKVLRCRPAGGLGE